MKICFHLRGGWNDHFSLNSILRFTSATLIELQDRFGSRMMNMTSNPGIGRLSVGEIAEASTWCPKEDSLLNPREAVPNDIRQDDGYVDSWSSIARGCHLERNDSLVLGSTWEAICLVTCGSRGHQVKLQSCDSAALIGSLGSSRFLSLFSILIKGN
jgi:hypothetical protein